MHQPPKGVRLHIGVYGRRNAGKSSLINALVGQHVSIVSATPGTTTDPVEKTLEMPPLGPVVLLDTAGLDDVGPLGEARMLQTQRTLSRVDMALLVVGANGWGQTEESLLDALRRHDTPCMVAFTWNDMAAPAPTALKRVTELGIAHCRVAFPPGGECRRGLPELREVLLRTASSAAPSPLSVSPILADLLPSPRGEEAPVVLLVTPVDSGAPKGRLILPQAQALRDALDAGAMTVMVRETELAAVLSRLTAPPDLVVCDSQVVGQTVFTVPDSIPLTTFSILMARCKGDLPLLAQGAAAIRQLRPGHRVLVAEACSHHPQADDIGRVKIPRWLRERVGEGLRVDFTAGADFPEDMTPWKLVLHCGACTLTRKAMHARMARAVAAGIPITNYGLAISLLQGALRRTLSPFPDAQAAFDVAAADAAV